jgi:hypothetical protein
MLNFKSLYRVLAILVFSSLLSGCGATYPTPAPSLPEKPAPEIEPVLPEPAPLPPSASQTEQKITEPLPAVMPEPEDTSTVKKEVYVNYGDIEFVQHRLIVYENKYKQWLNISAAPLNNTLAEKIASQKTECLNELEAIQNGYNQLMKMMQLAESLSSGTDAAVNPKNMQQVDIAFLEGRCNELLTLGIAGLGEGRPEAESKTSFAEEEDIASYMQEGNYPKVILTYTNLIQKFPDQKPSLTTRLNYGRALQYTGQLEAAARHFKNLLASGDISIDPITIQGAIADFLLADAKVDAAKFFYNSLIQEQQSLDAEKNWAQEQLVFLNSVDPDSEDMIAYMKLLREFQSSDYRIHAPRLNRMINDFANEHAGSPIAVSALRLKTFAVNRLKSWFGSQLVKIDTLVAEKKFTEANAVLKNLSNYYLPAELQSVLQKTFYDVAQTEFQEQENQQRLKKMELSSQWEAAVNLLDSQQYESAISAFASLMGTEYEKEAEVKIIEAANQAAGEMRKEAAALFIRAGKTQDLEQKKDLLLESHRLLTDILARYPQTELLDKVRQNISILEEQIDRLDPTLLERSSQENSAETSDPSHGLGSEQAQ